MSKTFLTTRTLAIGLLLLGAVSAFGQTQTAPAPSPIPSPSATPTPKPSPAAAAKSTDKKSYDALLERAKASDPTLDFTALRVAFYESSNYNPNTPMMTYRPLWGNLAQKNYPEAIKIAQSVLDKNFVEINAHLVAEAAYRESGELEKAKLHKYMADGLISSIKGKSDGKTMETAFHVISINEEYALMRTMNLRPIKQALVPDKGHFYDAITVVDPQTNEQSILYFNVDRIFLRAK